MNKFRVLEVTEYLSIAGSVVGSAFAVTTGQIIYATVPMSLSIVLNLSNRHQLEQRIRQRLDSAIIETRERVSEDIQLLREPVELANSSSKSENTQLAITNLLEKFDLLQSELKSDLSTKSISQLQSQIQQLQDSLNGLVYRLLSDGGLSSYDPKPAEKGIESIILQYQQEKSNRKHLYEFPDQ